MEIGMPILAELRTLREHIDLCKSLGFDFIELNMGFPCSMPDRIDWQEVKGSKGIFFTLHLPESIEVGQMYEYDRRRNVEYAIYLMKMFKDKGSVKKFNLHLGIGDIMTLPGGKIFLFEEHSDEYMKSLRKSFRELSEFAVEAGVTVCFENIGDARPFLLDSFKELLNFPSLSFTLDTGHDAKVGSVFSNLFVQSPEKVRHIHLHDYDGRSDHLELGVGVVDVQAVIGLARKSGATVLLEVRKKRELENSLGLLRSGSSIMYN